LRWTIRWTPPRRRLSGTQLPYCGYDRAIDEFTATGEETRLQDA
jgi:hypothetical protein